MQHLCVIFNKTNLYISKELLVADNSKVAFVIGKFSCFTSGILEHRFLYTRRASHYH